MSPVFVLDPKENTDHIEKTALYHYTYNWPIAHGKTQAVVFGWLRDLKNELVVYRALRDISEGEELCISYGAQLTFEDADKQDLEAEAEAETTEDILRIQLD
ncbi:hypothetical protein LTS10_007738 [Elasticomyces elasticus]|nr:hypothetical protein LTS10_007738 [Elasticomyces elasticus]